VKPMFLRLKAFGPFAGQIEVSFDRVFDGGLFLIHGRTGSGKTSLLDGLCFSLFGRPSSEEREKDMRALRSDLASLQTMTETELVFAVGSTAYRVVRVPTQATLKKRGEGFTEHKGSAELARFEGTLAELREFIGGATDLDAVEFGSLRWTPLAGKVEAVDGYIERLLGMNERQFRQVVILPQGRFREFLSSSSTERQAILEKLFQTDRFSRLQNYISARANADKTRFAAASEALFAKLKHFGLEQFGEIADRKSALQEKLIESTQLRSSARVHAEALASELNQAKEFEVGRARVETLTREKVALEARRISVDMSKQKVSKARKWAPFFDLEDQHTAAIAKTNERRQTQAATTLAAAEAVAKSQATQKKHAVLAAKKPSIEEMATERVRLREIYTTLTEIETARKRIDVERLQDAQARENAEGLKEESAQIERRQMHLLNSLFAIDEALRTREASELEKEDRKVREVELKFHLTEAVRLAASLRPGEPCPVCGSMAHPAPAHSADGPGASADDVKRVRANFEQRRLAAAELRAKRQSRLEPFVSLLRSPSSVELADLDFESAFNALEAGTKRLAELRASFDTQLTTFATREESRLKALNSLEERLGSIPLGDRSIENVKKRGVELKTEQEMREPELKNLELELNKTASELARLQGAQSALEDEISRLEVENLAREARLATTRPDGERPEERLDPAGLMKIESEIETYNEMMARNAASLEEVEQLLARHKGTRLSKEIEGDLQAATLRRNELEQTVAALSQELSGLIGLEKEVGTGQDRLAQLKSDAERGSRMAALLTGDRSQNKMLVPLARFVLQSRFDDVLEQANRRLGRMSRGQFQLRRPALSRNLRDSQGLELSVEDSVAGKERHAGSLSGGESFMAALSLALGLADVVQADLGGVKLDSVLIDEGFGTLDSESLELAMRTLVDLQDGGRVVGIISHVQELKSQVAHQLEVTKSPSGSRLEWRS
jgi:DNA repair protein SbcC/Rad50